jgi:hypothetical protein
MQLKLPRAAWGIPCFKKGTEVYLTIYRTLYSFTPLEVKPIKTVPENIYGCSSYYSRGTLLRVVPTHREDGSRGVN